MDRVFWQIAGPVVFLAFVLLYFPFVADDAFIVGRYALNFAGGNGLVYNIGEPVSALTSPLHALFVSALALVSEDPVAVARIIVPVFPVLGWLVVVRLVRLTTSQLAFVTAFAMASPFMALWTVGGLETPLLTLWLAIFAALIARGWQRGRFTSGDAVALGAVMGVAFLTRFDSLLVTLPVLLALAWANPRVPGVWIGAGLALAIAGAWLVPSFLYYGDVLPTSFYVKTTSDGGLTSHSVLTFANFLVISGLVFLAPAFLKRREEGAAGALGLGLRVAAMLLAIYALFTSGKHMMFGYRFFVPYLLPVGVLLALTVPQTRALRAVPWVMLGVSGLVGAWVHFETVNPQPHRLVGLAPLEYHNVSPRQYRHFMDVLEEDASLLVAEAERRGLEAPSVFLFTGGTGYWMRDFYVYEALVSYRHDCPNMTLQHVQVADYVQQLGMVSANEVFEDVAGARHAGAEPVYVGATDLFFERDTYIRYLANPPTQEVRFPARVGDACEEAVARR